MISRFSKSRAKAAEGAEDGAHHPHDGGGGAAMRFPTREELADIRREWRADGAFDAERLSLRFSRYLREQEQEQERVARPANPLLRLGGRFAERTSTDLNIGTRTLGERLGVRNWPDVVFQAMMRRRLDHRDLSPARRKKFNDALRAAHARGDYPWLADWHKDMSHRMHSMAHAGPAGAQRFLPWHRIYLFACEEFLRTTHPTLTIPYWDFANDPSRPDWVWQPPGVVRNTPGANGGSLPSQATVDGILLRSTYTDFTESLESDAHNDVHTWCNGTISDVATSPQDPIFWLLHANVDRIWDTWQLTHSGKPNLAGVDAYLDPTIHSVDDVNDISSLGYSY
ncbi:tyrosinase family protein [Streptomyces sp. NPDC048349]|uniref:tyrosinase family protein n=1 Tax=Streptomyces sp. NPDC048349 TaxID=3155486 RepID=UPI00343CE0D7